MPLAVIAMVVAAFTLPEGAWRAFTLLSALLVGGNLLIVLSGMRRLLRQVSRQAPAHPTL